MKAAVSSSLEARLPCHAGHIIFSSRVAISASIVHAEHVAGHAFVMQRQTSLR